MILNFLFNKESSKTEAKKTEFTKKEIICACQKKLNEINKAIASSELGGYTLIYLYMEKKELEKKIKEMKDLETEQMKQK